MFLTRQENILSGTRWLLRSVWLTGSMLCRTASSCRQTRLVVTSFLLAHGTVKRMLDKQGRICSTCSFKLLLSATVISSMDNDLMQVMRTWIAALVSVYGFTSSRFSTILRTLLNTDSVSELWVLTNRVFRKVKYQCHSSGLDLVKLAASSTLDRASVGSTCFRADTVLGSDSVRSSRYPSNKLEIWRVLCVNWI